ncbi:DUF1992 domain-containing protein [Microlunatus panaciterrae]|uniref:DnaJ homologue subfamily C member 28 conserved domain-containing protein n=1 Tax=Microlunatus panaciterrae TaxID=400768 RepID=A0ABS2RL96_9ACTN|nr:DUF1992 domain-containing protein [Microlunatus panaciterrae]MBM7799347.1 hypothetical protein [Microlunatus panaciterrae]
MPPFESWIDRQIREAQERGEFDNLPGSGKPIKGLDGRPDENWWVKGLMEREKISAPLPGSLLLRKEVANLQEALAEERSEDTVRAIIENLNSRIRESRIRGIDGPNIFIKTVDVEQAVQTWREGRG